MAEIHIPIAETWHERNRHEESGESVEQVIQQLLTTQERKMNSHTGTQTGTDGELAGPYCTALTAFFEITDTLLEYVGDDETLPDDRQQNARRHLQEIRAQIDSFCADVHGLEGIPDDSTVTVSLEEATTTDHPIPMVIRGGPSSVTHLGPDPTIFEHESPRGGADE